MDDDLLAVPGLDQLLERHRSSLDGSPSTHPVPQRRWWQARASRARPPLWWNLPGLRAAERVDAPRRDPPAYVLVVGRRRVLGGPVPIVLPRADDTHDRVVLPGVHRCGLRLQDHLDHRHLLDLAPVVLVRWGREGLPRHTA